MKPMPFNRRAFLKGAVASNAAAVIPALPGSTEPQQNVPLPVGATAGQSRLTPEEQALIRAAVEQRLAAGERSLL